MIKCFKIKTLSPIHIGTGDTITPVDYIVKDNYLYFIDKDIFMYELLLNNKYKEFLDNCNKGTCSSILEIRSFIRNNISDNSLYYKIPVTQEYLKKYEKNIKRYAQKEDKKINSLEIYENIKNNVFNCVYIPGSSLKGSIRTAFLNYITKDKPEIINSEDLEKNILGYKEAEDDPFKYLKVSDFILYKGKSYIDKVVNVNKIKSKEEKVYHCLELIEKDSEFIGSIKIINNNKFDFSKIFESLNYFYNKVKEFENEKFNSNISNSNNILKIGKHSGAFAITVEGYREINSKKKDKQGKEIGILKEFQDTTWQADNMPIGWIEIEEIEEKKYIEVYEEIDKEKQEKVVNLKNKKEIIENIKLNLENEKQEKEKKRKLEQEKKILEKEERKEEEERRLKMSEFELLIENIKNTDESEIGKFFKNIKNFNGEEKIEIAKAFKEKYIEFGRWFGKQSKEQRERRKILKEILGE